MRRMLALAALVLVACSAPAHAKDIQRAVVCGQDRCTELANPHSLSTGWSPRFSLPLPEPYFRFKLFYGGGHLSEPGFYVPGAARVATSSGDGAGYLWSVPQQAALQAFRRITRWLKPFPRPRFRQVTVGGHVVAEPRSYERLLTLNNSASMHLAEADWQRIEFGSARANPWSLSRIRYSPGSDILSRNLDWVKVPPRLAAAIEARSSLDERQRRADGSRGAGSLAVLVGLLIAAMLVRKNRA